MNKSPSERFDYAWCERVHNAVRDLQQRVSQLEEAATRPRVRVRKSEAVQRPPIPGDWKAPKDLLERPPVSQRRYLLKRLPEILKAAGRPVYMKELVDVTGLPRWRLATPIKNLVEDGEVTIDGIKSGAVYALAQQQNGKAEA